MESTPHQGAQRVALFAVILILSIIYLPFLAKISEILTLESSDNNPASSEKAWGKEKPFPTLGEPPPLVLPPKAKKGSAECVPQQADDTKGVQPSRPGETSKICLGRKRVRWMRDDTT